MGVFDRLFGKGRDVRSARRAELRGELEKAVELYGLAGAPEEAARVMLLRGDAETDPRVRMRHYTQAVATAPERHSVREEARRKRAALLVAQFAGGASTENARRELRGAGQELLDVGDATAAAEAFKLAGDGEGEAKALAQAGDVESLELLLSEQEKKDRVERAQKEVHAEIEMLAASGRRREALAAAEKWIAAHDDAALRDRAAMIKARRALGPIARVAIHGKKALVVLGENVIIGRTEGALQIASHAVSRRHVRIAREGAAVTVSDLGSRNGTQLRGMNIAGAIPVGDGVELTLGKEVRVRIAKAESMTLDDAVTIELGGETYLAPLGAARVSGSSWELATGVDEWIELVAHTPAFLGDISLAERTTLAVGDIITSERGGPEILRVVGE